MKKKYFDVIIEYMAFEECDVITTSGLTSVDEQEKVTDPYGENNKWWF